MKTSTKISLLFTSMTIVIMLVFTSILQIIYFQRRYKTVNEKSHLPPPMMEPMRRFLPKDMGPKKLTLTDPVQQKALAENHIFLNIYHRDNTWLLVQKNPKARVIMPIDNQMEGQEKLFQVSLFLILLFAGLSYLASRIFVYMSLKDLRKLLGFVQQLDLHRLDQHFAPTGPADDEITILGDALNTSLGKIHQQTKTLKDFVAHASHELKTPLMAIASSVEYMHKAKSYDQTLPDLTKSIKNMQHLTERLLTLARLETTARHHSPTDLIPFIHKTMEDIIPVYEKKHLTTTVDLPATLIISIDPIAFGIICTNLFDNACKYANDGGTITIMVREKKRKIEKSIENSTTQLHTLVGGNMQTRELSITNTGPTIDPEHLEHIWKQFWRADDARNDTASFGLGLTLVRKVVTMLGWTVDVVSKDGKTTFTVKF